MLASQAMLLLIASRGILMQLIASALLSLIRAGTNTSSAYTSAGGILSRSLIAIFAGPPSLLVTGGTLVLLVAVEEPEQAALLLFLLMVVSVLVLSGVPFSRPSPNNASSSANTSSAGPTLGGLELAFMSPRLVAMMMLRHFMRAKCSSAADGSGIAAIVVLLLG